MPIGDVDVLFTADDASVLRALAAQERAIQQSAGKMEREWNTATEKAGKMLYGFGNIGKAAMYGVGASVAIGINAMNAYAASNAEAGRQLQAVKRELQGLNEDIGKDLFGLVDMGSAKKAVAWVREFRNGLVDSLASGIREVFTGESIAGELAAQHAMDERWKKIAAEQGRSRQVESLRLERELIQAGLLRAHGIAFAADQLAAEVRYQQALAKIEETRRSTSAGPSDFGNNTVVNAMRRNADAQLAADLESARVRRNDDILKGIRASREAEDQDRRDRFEASAKAREEAEFRKQSYEIDALASDGYTRDAEIARVRLEYAKQYLDVERDTLLTIEERAGLIESMQRAEAAAVRSITEKDQQATGGRGVNVGVGSAGIANSVLASAGRRDVAAAVDRVGRIASEIKQILERNPGTATFGR